MGDDKTLRDAVAEAACRQLDRYEWPRSAQYRNAISFAVSHGVEAGIRHALADREQPPHGAAPEVERGEVREAAPGEYDEWASGQYIEALEAERDQLRARVRELEGERAATCIPEVMAVVEAFQIYQEAIIAMGAVEVARSAVVRKARNLWEAIRSGKRCGADLPTGKEGGES